MKVKDIGEHFLSRVDWVDRDNTVDRIIVGDPERDVQACLVTWMPSFDAIRTTVARGVSLLVCHEPTFWDHGDDTPGRKPRVSEKLRFIHEHGLTILRNHDCWDRWPKIGIPWAWASFLGLKGAPAVLGADGYQHRYDIAPVPFEEFAREIAARTATIGEPLVEGVGDPEQPVSKIGIGTGCGCNVFTYLDMGCDCCIICDDGTAYWRGVQYAEDLGIPVICVNHATSEEPGMVTLTQYINEEIEGVTAEHLVQGCRFKLIGSERGTL